jgi:uncharacterized hydrophobic protein (TIGR00271 family)
VLHLRLIVPDDLVEAVMTLLDEAPGVTNLWHIRGAASKPVGALISCDVAKEDASTVLEGLRLLNLSERGSIAAEYLDAAISIGALDAELAAAGNPADAVVWEEVEGRVADSASLSISFLVLMTLATMIAAIGVITDSIVLVIGAMVVGPEYGPLAGLCVAVVEGRLNLAMKSLRALLIGFPLGIISAALLTGALVAFGIAPDALVPEEHELTLFISDPNWYTVIVSVLAGVLISVTTIPAAANVGVAAVYGDWDDVAGAALQLVINLLAIVLSGIAVLWVIKRARLRRLARGKPVSMRPRA